MQLLDLAKPLEDMTDEELHEQLKGLRHNRTIERPASKARVKKAAKKGNVGRINKTENLFNSLTDAEKRQLLLALGVNDATGD